MIAILAEIWMASRTEIGPHSLIPTEVIALAAEDRR